MAHSAGSANAFAGPQPPLQSGSNFRKLWLPALFCLLLLGAELYLVFNDLNGTARREEPHEGAPIAVFLSAKNRVRQKTAGTIVWTSPNEGQRFFLDDAIATMTDAQADVRFSDDSEVLIEPDSMIVFEKVPTESKAQGVILRLIKGSLTRKNGKAGRILLKFSDDPGARLHELDDSRGDAIFRIVQRGGGFEVIVENGSLEIDHMKRLGSHDRSVVDTPDKLPAPRLKKPEIEIQSVLERLRSRLFAFLCIIAQASADEPPPSPSPASTQARIVIHFSWNTVSGAQSYKIQIADDSDFTRIVSEDRTRETEYHYHVAPPAKPATLYFRVSALDASGLSGDFSSVEKAEITPLAPPPVPVEKPAPTPVPSPAPSFTPRPHPKPAPAPVRPKPRPKVAVITAKIPGPPPVPKPVRLRLSLGAALHSRTFKSSTAPETVTASGIVPALLQLEADFYSERILEYRAGVSILAETGKPTDPQYSAVNPSKIALPVFRAWGTWESACGSSYCGIGPYASTSDKFTWSGITPETQSVLLAGLLFDFMPDPTRERSWRWDLQAAAIGVGSIGGELAASLTHPIFPGRSRSSALDHGFFMEFEAQGRFISIETSYLGAISFGYAF